MSDLNPEKTMSRDLIRSRALSEKKRAEVADGTANMDRTQRMKEKALILDKIFEHKPIDLTGSKSDELKTLLDIIAKTRGMVGNRSSLRRLDDCTTD
jgi:wobble nucleotide-excising tRNase